MRAKLNIRWSTAIAVSVGALLITLAPPALAGGSTAPVPVGAAASAGHISKVVASATWGVSNGKPFVKITKGTIVGHYKPSALKVDHANVPAASGNCTEDISNVTRSGGFYWSTSQICSGHFGAQDMKTQMWRSSYSGPRGYTSWAYYPASGLYSRSSISQNWTIACNNGRGYYDYYPVMQGYASSLGSGPVIRSGNQLNHQDCGPTAP
jgi:hypothetical protein